jgi:hypothetical protein
MLGERKGFYLLWWGGDGVEEKIMTWKEQKPARANFETHGVALLCDFCVVKYPFTAGSELLE